jgi:hypothetical protein
MNHDNSNDKKYPEGHFIGLWIGIGIAIASGVGIPLSIALDMPGLIGIGPGMGVALGVAIGTAAESKAKKEGRIIPREQSDNKKINKSLIAGILILMAGVLLAVFFWLKNQ